MQVFTKSYWDNHSLIFRAIFTLLGSAFIFISFWNFAATVSMPTDENLFRDPISKFYMTKGIKSFNIKEGKKEADSIHIGDLLLKVNEKKIDSANQIMKIVFSLPDTSIIKFQVACIHRKEIRNTYVRRADLSGKFFVVLKSAVLVTSITDGGASDRAGLKVGDLITKINDKTFKSALEADMIMRTLETNNDFVYEILRDGNLYNVTIRLAKFGVSFSYLLSFLSGFFFIATGLFFGVARPQFIAARLTALALLLVGFSITGRMNPSIAFYLYSSPFLITLIILTKSAFLLGIAIFIHSTFYFPVERSSLLEKHKWLLFIPYSIATIAIALILYLIVDRHVSQDVSSYFTLIVSFGFIAYVIFITIKYRESLSKNNRKIGRAIFFALNLNLAALSVYPLAILFKYSNPILEYVSLLIVLIPAAYIYTIARYRLLDLDLRLRKNNQYLLIIFSWKALLFMAFFTFMWCISHLDMELPNIHFTGTSIEVLEKPLKEDNLNFYNTTISITLSLLFAYLLLKLYRSGFDYINKKYFRTSFDYRKASIDLSQVLESDLTVDSFMEIISNKIKSIILINKIGIILFDEEGKISNAHLLNLQSSDFSLSLKDKEQQIFNVFNSISESFRVEYFADEFKNMFINEGFATVIPIKSKGKVAGAVFLGDKLAETPINNEDVLFVQSFTSQAMVAIENLKLYEDLAKKERMRHELELARKIQLSSLPCIKPNVRGMEIASTSIPAFEVGGDFYDYLNVGEREITIVVGDVSGKGASAALYMSKVQGILRTLADFKLSPKDLLAKTNALLHRYIEKNSFISVVSAAIDLNKMLVTVARGGHLPVFMYSTLEKRVIEIKPKGLILGASSETFFKSNIEEESVGLAVGDILLFATDGAIEARMDGDEFGIERLKALISHFKYLNPDDLLQHILMEINRFCDTEVGDDLTLVIVKIV